MNVHFLNLATLAELQLLQSCGLLVIYPRTILQTELKEARHSILVQASLLGTCHPGRTSLPVVKKVKVFCGSLS